MNFLDKETVIKQIGETNYNKAVHKFGNGNFYNYIILETGIRKAISNWRDSNRKIVSEYISDDIIEKYTKTGNKCIDNKEFLPVYENHSKGPRSPKGYIVGFYNTTNPKTNKKVSAAVVRFNKEIDDKYISSNYKSISGETKEEFDDKGNVIDIMDISGACFVKDNTKAGVTTSQIIETRAADVRLTINDVKNAVKDLNIHPTQLYDLKNIMGSIDVDNNGEVSYDTRNADREVVNIIEGFLKRYKKKNDIVYENKLKEATKEKDGVINSMRHKVYKAENMSFFKEMINNNTDKRYSKFAESKFEKWDADPDKTKEENYKSFTDGIKNDWESIKSIFTDTNNVEQSNNTIAQPLNSYNSNEVNNIYGNQKSDGNDINLSQVFNDIASGKRS